MQKLFLVLTVIMFATLVACGTGAGVVTSSEAPPYGESVVAVSGYSCAASNGIATATVSMTTTESISPEAYIEISTTLESQINLTSQEGNCTSSAESVTPMCIYTFTWTKATAPLQTLYFQLNGGPGPYFLTTMNVGGTICPEI